jgi:hypothetical protein
MSNELKTKGEQILYEEGLFQNLEKIGKVQIVGSYDLDLLIKPDIDITIGVEEYDLEKYFSVCKEIAEKLKPIRIKYLDQSVAQFDAFPFDAGYFLGINLNREDIKWSIDTWIFTNDIFKERVKYHNEIKEKLNEENRKIIMNIKEVIHNNPKYMSVDIYSAVLFDNVKTEEEYYEWYENKYSVPFISN